MIVVLCIISLAFALPLALYAPEPESLSAVISKPGLYSYLGPNHRDLAAGTAGPGSHLLGACSGAACVFFVPARAVSRRRPA